MNTVISINKCKQILGKAGENLTDKKIEEIKNCFVTLTDLIIDMELEKLKLKNFEYEHENTSSNS